MDCEPTHFVTPDDTERRLMAAGSTEVRRWQQPEPTTLEDRGSLETSLHTVCLRLQVDRMPTSEHQAFLQEVMRQGGAPVIDQVRMSITARRSEIGRKQMTLQRGAEHAVRTPGSASTSGAGGSSAQAPPRQASRFGRFAAMTFCFELATRGDRPHAVPS